MDVALLDPIQQHVARVEFVAASQMLLAPNVQLAGMAITHFPTATNVILIQAGGKIVAGVAFPRVNAKQEAVVLIQINKIPFGAFICD